jgi:hypothetical protein
MKPLRSKKRRATSLASREQSPDALIACRRLDPVVQLRGDAVADGLPRAEQAVDVPIRLEVDECDHAVPFVDGDRDQMVTFTGRP